MRPLNISLEGLIVLVTVAQEGSLLRGGRTLGLGKSAVGKQIAVLEEAVGTPLFDRWRGRWILNEEGRLLAARAFQAILDIRMGLAWCNRMCDCGRIISPWVTLPFSAPS